METELYKAVIHTALTDLFKKKKKSDQEHRQAAWEWFNDEEDFIYTKRDQGVTFMTCCDFADYDHKQWRYVACLIYSEKLTKKEYIELMDAEATYIEVVELEQLINSQNIVRYTFTDEDAELYVASLNNTVKLDK